MIKCAAYKVLLIRRFLAEYRENGKILQTGRDKEIV